ncbi:KinB-signaling pathway activation protein [Caryophanon tenue]|uniref:KinB-signaling pathway activation protein n=1 Tax=Caryophanon tenue TaxID=33978 RepID=A0A1C0YLI4_9BACL|nr:KinB-signaling pathway activation protein [Caryophanon tenue]OCS88035.1 KinB-signaling pathway activation protein [Caryophanon tenue]
MTIRNFIKFAFWGILLGGSLTSIASLLIRWDIYAPYIQAGEFGEVVASFVWMFLLGVTMAVISQAGYFAYLTIHQIGVGVFKSLTLWNWVQVLLIVVVIVDLVVFRFLPFTTSWQTGLFYGALLFVLIGCSFVTAHQKVKLTGKKHIFIPSLFFMIVVTTLEWTIALMGRDVNIDSYVALLLFPLVAVNAYQLLVLPKYNAMSERDRLRLAERKAARKQQENAQA